MNRRHLFALALAMLCLIAILHLQGCAADYTWTRAKPAAQSIDWRVVSREQMYFVCQESRDRAPNLGGCAWWNPDVCIVYSYMDAESAKRTISGDGMNLYEHEAKHCDGFSHQTFQGRM